MTMDHENVLEHLDKLLELPDFRTRLLAILATRGLFRPSRSSVMRYRVEVTRSMLAAGWLRRDVQCAIRQRFGISRTQAYVLISKALEKGKR